MTQIRPAQADAKPSRIQLRNRGKILDAALEVFSAQGFRGATLDQIARQAGLSKPNILYYFSGKEEIHVTLLTALMDTWLAPMREIDPDGEPLEEIMRYVHRKLEMSRELPRESRLFANEILQGAPMMGARAGNRSQAPGRPHGGYDRSLGRAGQAATSGRATPYFLDLGHDTALRGFRVAAAGLDGGARCASGRDGVSGYALPAHAGGVTVSPARPFKVCAIR